MIKVLVVCLVIAGFILWLTIYITNKAYQRKWDQEDPVESTDDVSMGEKSNS